MAFARYPATDLHIEGTRGTGQFLVRVERLAVVLADGTQVMCLAKRRSMDEQSDMLAD